MRILVTMDSDSGCTTAGPYLTKYPLIGLGTYYRHSIPLHLVLDAIVLLTKNLLFGPGKRARRDVRRGQRFQLSVGGKNIA